MGNGFLKLGYSNMKCRVIILQFLLHGNFTAVLPSHAAVCTYGIKFGLIQNSPEDHENYTEKVTSLFIFVHTLHFIYRTDHLNFVH